uniref:Uncharacterized protein n=1 Tax=Timema tahoe TaxID=61484 RepID=A0A7R9NXA6_9NEOP|nr:unnamed protein product [Timema tahoe]
MGVICLLCSLTGKFLLLIAVALLILKLYLLLCKGVCTSRRRMDGKTVIITGANTGIGKETALNLARRGARVILACRDMDKTNQACREIISKTGNKEVIGHHIDLSSLQSVRDFARVILTTESRLDVLVNNAGAAGLSRKRTQDGLQIEMQVNHFGPFLLVNLLLVTKDLVVELVHQYALFTVTKDLVVKLVHQYALFTITKDLVVELVHQYALFTITKELVVDAPCSLGLLKRSAPSRIIMVTSLLHTRSKLDLTSLDADDWFDDENLYSTSKLANILVANELARKLRGSVEVASSSFLTPSDLADSVEIWQQLNDDQIFSIRPAVTSSVVSPREQIDNSPCNLTGVTANSTHPGFVATEVFRRLRGFRKTLLDIVIKFYAKTPEEGAQTTIYLAASEEVEGISGKYFVDCKETKTSLRAQNVALAKKLWEKSELLVKMSRDEIHY